MKRKEFRISVLLAGTAAVAGIAWLMTPEGLAQQKEALTADASDPGKATSGAPNVAVANPDGEWASVKRRTMRYETPAVGSFKAQQTTLIGTQVSGRVQEVLVDVGDEVKKGQEMVRIDATFFKLELEQKKADLETYKARAESSRQSIQTAQADLAVVKASVADAELELQRMKSLWEKPNGESPSIPKRMYDEALFRKQQESARLESAQSHLAEAQARSSESASSLKQAEAAVKYAEQRLGETNIRAPYDAVVTERLVDAGESVTSTPISHLLKVQEVDTLELEFSLPQSMLSRVQKGTPVDYEVEGIDVGKGTGPIAVVFPEVDEATRSFRCKVLIDNKEMRFRPGLLARVRLVNERKDVLVVPRQSLLQSASGWQIQVREGGQAVPRMVQVGLLTEDEAEVRSGLKEGDEVLVSREEE